MYPVPYPGTGLDPLPNLKPDLTLSLNRIVLNKKVRIQEGGRSISLFLPVQTAVLVHVGQVPDFAQHGHRQLRAQHHVPHLHTRKVRFPQLFSHGKVSLKQDKNNPCKVRQVK